VGDGDGDGDGTTTSETLGRGVGFTVLDRVGVGVGEEDGFLLGDGEGVGDGVSQSSCPGIGVPFTPIHCCAAAGGASISSADATKAAVTPARYRFITLKNERTPAEVPPPRSWPRHVSGRRVTDG
jgi:hypothetical protein